VRALRRATKALQITMVERTVTSSVEPIVCFTNALMGRRAMVRGIRYLTLKDLVGDIVSRGATLERARAQRAARALGMDIVGDENRHFVAG